MYYRAVSVKGRDLMFGEVKSKWEHPQHGVHGWEWFGAEGRLHRAAALSRGEGLTLARVPSGSPTITEGGVSRLEAVLPE